MRESISKQERVSQRSKVRGQIASRDPTQTASGFRRIVGIAGGLLTAAPASVLACPVCGLVGTSDNTWAYQTMSAMLTLLPLAMIGATVWWFARLVARADGARQSATQRPPEGRAIKHCTSEAEPLARV